MNFVPDFEIKETNLVIINFHTLMVIDHPLMRMKVIFHNSYATIELVISQYSE